MMPTIAPHIPMHALANSAEFLGDEDHRFTLEVAEPGETWRTVISFREPLDFHAQRHGPAVWGAWTEPDGYLQREHEATVVRRLAEHLAAVVGPEIAETLEITAADDDSDEPSMTIEIQADYRDGETFGAWLDRIGWPIVATLTNVSDPGTFNSPYLFTSFDD